MPSLYNNDTIHTFRIRMSEELCVLDLAKVNDPVLKRLLDMGCFDWKAPNSVSGPGNGIAYSVMVTSRLLPTGGKNACIQGLHGDYIVIF